MEQLAKAQSKRKKREGEQPPPLYTTLFCGVPGRGLKLIGYVSRPRALAYAKKHYERELEKIHQALEAIENNYASIYYKIGETTVSAVEAQRYGRPDVSAEKASQRV